MVNIDLKNPERYIGIGADLKINMQTELNKFFQQNVSTFTWSIEYMIRIDPKVTTHKLNVDPTYKPIK